MGVSASGDLASRRYDVCIFGNPENVLLAWLLKKKGVVETLVYDDWDYYAGFEEQRLTKLVMTWREKLCISCSDIVISVGSLLSDLRKKQGARRAFVIPNGVDYQLFARAQQKKPHPPTLIYTGTIDEWSGLDVSIEGFAYVRNKIPNSRYLVIGHGEREYLLSLRSLVSKLNLNGSVLFLGYKQCEELPQFLAEADVGVALFQRNDRMKYAFHLKVVEYMAAGLAVIGSKIGETEKMIVESSAGEALEYSCEQFASAVIKLLTDHATFKTTARLARNTPGCMSGIHCLVVYTISLALNHPRRLFFRLIAITHRLCSDMFVAVRVPQLSGAPLDQKRCSFFYSKARKEIEDDACQPRMFELGPPHRPTAHCVCRNDQLTGS